MIEEIKVLNVRSLLDEPMLVFANVVNQHIKDSYCVYPFLHLLPSFIALLDIDPNEYELKQDPAGIVPHRMAYRVVVTWMILYLYDENMSDNDALNHLYGMATEAKDKFEENLGESAVSYLRGLPNFKNEFVEETVSMKLTTFLWGG